MSSRCSAPISSSIAAVLVLSRRRDPQATFYLASKIETDPLPDTGNSPVRRTTLSLNLIPVLKCWMMQARFEYVLEPVDQSDSAHYNVSKFAQTRSL